MVAEVFAGIGAFKAMLDTAKALKDMNDAAVRNAAVIDLSQKIIDAQQEQMTLIQRVSTLEAEMASFKTWEAEKQRYELQPLREGVFAYTVKPDAQGAEPPHSICPDCYQQNTKSILQTVMRVPGRSEVRLCQRCGWEAYMYGAWQPEHGGTRSASRHRP